MLHSASNSINENENDDVEQQQQQDNVVQEKVETAAAKIVLFQRASKRMQKTVVEGTRSISLSTQIAATATVAQVMNAVNEIGSNPLQQEEGENRENGNDDDVGSGGGGGGVIVKGQANDKWITKVDERGVFVVGITAFFAACWSFIAVVGQLADLSSLTVLLLSPTVIIQKTKLNKLGSLRTLHNELRTMARQLAMENVQMQQSITSMETHLQRLQNVESQLTNLANKSGTGSAQQSVERLVHVVEEHGQLQAELKRVLQEDVTHQLFSALLQSDVNGNYRLSHPDETSILEQRLQNVQGVVFNVVNFRNLLQSSDGTFDLTLTDAANLARELQKRDDEIPDADKVFIFRPLDILTNKTTTTTTTTTTTATSTVTAAAATAATTTTTKTGTAAAAS